MLPWGHAAVGYLLYSGWHQWRAGGPPHGFAVIALAIGTQFPDLLDKPLSWTLAILPTGRSLGHSVFTLGVLAVVLLAFARRYDRYLREKGMLLSPSKYTTGAHSTADRSTHVLDGGAVRPATTAIGAFVLGYGSHLLADSTVGIATGNPDVSFLLYPLLPVGVSEHGRSFLEFFLSLTLTPMLAFELALTAVAIGVWLRDGRPGLRTLVVTARNLTR